MMDNRLRLRDFGICLIVLTLLDVFTSVSTLLAGYFNGMFDRAFAGVDATVISATKVVMGVMLAFWAILIVAQILIALNGIKNSNNPTANKGYITAAKVFFALNLLGAISYFVSMFNMNAETAFDIVLAFASAACNVAAYAYFIKYANAVRNETLRG